MTHHDIRAATAEGSASRLRCRAASRRSARTGRTRSTPGKPQRGSRSPRTGPAYVGPNAAADRSRRGPSRARRRRQRVRQHTGPERSQRHPTHVLPPGHHQGAPPEHIGVPSASGAVICEDIPGREVQVPGLERAQREADSLGIDHVVVRWPCRRAFVVNLPVCHRRVAGNGAGVRDRQPRRKTTTPPSLRCDVAHSVTRRHRQERGDEIGHSEVDDRAREREHHGLCKQESHLMPLRSRTRPRRSRIST